MTRRAAVSLLGLALLACASRAPSPAHELADGRYAMGTVLEVALHGGDAAALRRARDRLFALAEELESRLSTYREQSDVSRLNAAAGAALTVDPEVAGLLRRAKLFSGLTRGSFDVTVGPLVSLWTHAAQEGVRPTPAALAAARQRVGPEHIQVGTGRRVALEAGSRIDLGGVAKGYALDRMLPLLREHGIGSALLSFGQSSAWAVGAPPDADGWRLLVRAPGEGFAGVLTLRDRALSVSSSLAQWSEIGGRRYGHVLDPRSGEPLTRSREAVVVARDAALAEALSKAVLVLGAAEGLAVVEALVDCEALLLEAGRGPRATSGFAATARLEPF